MRSNPHSWVRLMPNFMPCKSSQWMLMVDHPMAFCLPPSDRSGSVLGPWGHPTAAQQAFPAPVCGSRAFTSKLRPQSDPGPPEYHTKLWIPVPSSSSKPDSDHIDHTHTTASLQKPSAYPRASGNLFFSSFSIFPQVAFPCKMPDMTPEGDLGDEAPSQRGSPGI